MFKKLALFGFLCIFGMPALRCEGSFDALKAQLVAHPVLVKLVQHAGIACAAGLTFDSLIHHFMKIDEEKYKQDCEKAKKNKANFDPLYVPRAPYYSSKVQTLIATGMVLTVIAGCVAFAGFGQSVAEGLGVKSLRAIVWG